MKITFVQAEPPTSIHDVQFPAGIGALEAILSRAGHDVSILWRVADWLTLEKVGARLREIDPDMVCISFCFSVLPEIERLVPVIRQSCPDAAVVIGGPGVTYSPKLALQKTGADWAIIGEGETALRRMADNDLFPPGLAWLDSQGKIPAGGRGEIMPLENIPLPTWDKYPMHWYQRLGAYFFRSVASPPDRTFTWLASRGCPYSCNFCVSGCAPRYKKIEQLEAELDEIYERFHPTFIGWMDNLLLASKSYCLAFCDLHRRKDWDWRYSASGHAARIDQEMLAALQASGCASILYGVESANDNILAMIGKGQTVEQLERAIRLTKEAGIAVQLSAMFGQPGETAEDFQRTIQMIATAGDAQHPTSNNQGLSPVMTFPGTPLYRWALENGYFRDDEDYYQQFFHPEDRHQGFMNYTAMTRQEVIRWHEIARAVNEWRYYRDQQCWRENMLRTIGIKIS